MLKKLLGIALLVFPGLAHAACEGQDLRDALSAQDTQLIRSAVLSDPYSQGNHWIATRDDQTLHLVGTLHINDPRMGDITERLRPMIASADVLLLEVDKAQVQSLQAGDMSMILLNKGPTLIDIMGDAAWAEFSDTLRAHQVPPWMAAKMRPWLLGQMLSTPPCKRNQTTLQLGMDRRLEIIAEAEAVPVASLETMQEVFDLLNSRPLADQVDDLLLSVDLFGKGLDYTQTLTEGYFDEDVAFVFELIKYHSKRALGEDDANWEDRWASTMDLLLDTRNRRWMDKLLARDDETIVVAVGAAHLPGRAGLLHLLAESGFSISRAAF